MRPAPDEGATPLPPPPNGNDVTEDDGNDYGKNDLKARLFPTDVLNIIVWDLSDPQYTEGHQNAQST